MVANWKPTKLGDIIKVTHGWPFKSPLMSEELTTKPIVVNIGNFEYTGGFRFSETRTREYRGEYPLGYELNPGEILLAMTCQTAGGEILGIPGRIPDDGKVYLHNQRMGRVVPNDKDTVDLDFLYYLFLSKSFNNHLCASATGTKIVHTAPTRIEAYEFNLPPIETQIAIGQVLSSLDAKIELNRSMNRTLEAMAQAIFKSWFVDFEPVRAKVAAKAAGASPVAIERAAMASIAGKTEAELNQLSEPQQQSLAQTAALFPDAFQDSTLGEIPKGWKVSLLSDLCARIFSGGTPRTTNPEFWDGGIPWLSSGETREGFIIRTDKSITRRGVESSSTREARSGSVVIASAGQGKTRGQTSFLGFDSYINQSVISLEADLTIITDPFLFFNLAPRYEQFRQLSDAHSSRGSLTTKLLAGICTVHPALSLISRFDDIATPMIQRILANERESMTLADLRDALIPKLLSGELSLK